RCDSDIKNRMGANYNFISFQQGIAVLEAEMSQTQPKISCLMVTLDRLELVKRSVRLYCEQTYANKELLITPDGGLDYRRQIQQHVASLNRSDIRVVEVHEKSSWGRLQNISMKSASGDFLCVWDDD